MITRGHYCIKHNVPHRCCAACLSETPCELAYEAHMIVYRKTSVKRKVLNVATWKNVSGELFPSKDRFLSNDFEELRCNFSVFFQLI